MRVFVNDDHRLHQTKLELVPGKFVPCLDTIARVDAVAEALHDRNLGKFVYATAANKADILAVHTPDYIEFLETAWAEWCEAFDAETDGFPFVWPNWRLTRKCPKTIDGKIGYYSIDGISPITEGVWPAAIGAAGAALAAARSVIDGDRISFALCRPPGHHAGPDLMGGTSYINHTALAANLMTVDGGRTAIVDIDAHHGNGAQLIFWDRDDVLTISVHGDPAYEFPYFSGYADETGEGVGEGLNLNLPLPIGATIETYLSALDLAIERVTDFGPDLLVIALGVDAVQEDPGGHLGLLPDDFSTIGERLAGLGLPAVAVLEGGYRLDVMGACVANVLEPFQ